MTVIHYHHYEATAIRRLAARYGDPGDLAAGLLDRMVDICKELQRCVVLPLTSYSLKTVARWLGFAWSDTAASATQSMVWYRDWLETGDRSRLDSCLVYNRDDCRATCLVTRWLETAGVSTSAAVGERAPARDATI